MPVSAHIEPGTWKGVVSKDAACFMEVGARTFENNIPNPVNERIQITIGSTAYSVRHPYQIDTNEGKVTFDHDLFESVVPTMTGAFALKIHMKRSETYEGPSRLSVMEHDWKSGFREVVHCSDLKKVD